MPVTDFQRRKGAKSPHLWHGAVWGAGGDRLGPSTFALPSSCSVPQGIAFLQFLQLLFFSVSSIGVGFRWRQSHPVIWGTAPFWNQSVVLGMRCPLSLILALGPISRNARASAAMPLSPLFLPVRQPRPLPTWLPHTPCHQLFPSEYSSPISRPTLLSLTWPTSLWSPALNSCLGGHWCYWQLFWTHSSRQMFICWVALCSPLSPLPAAIQTRLNPICCSSPQSFLL